MKRFHILVLGLSMATVLPTGAFAIHAAPSSSSITTQLDGGEKEKKEKGGKKEKDESTKDAKTNGESIKPSQHARASAKAAIASQKLMRQEVMARAKVRLFFHNMFNTKYGKPVNFRSTRARNRWSKGYKRNR